MESTNGNKKSKFYGLKVGEPFNPYRMFCGIFTPEAMIAYHGISAEAKDCYGILCRFAGEHGHCFPGQEKLAEIMGVSERQSQRYIAELVDDGWIRVNRRGLGQTNTYDFLLHERYLNTTEASPLDTAETSSRIRQQMSPLIRQQVSSLDTTTDVVSHIKEEENQYKRITLRESEPLPETQDSSGQNTQTPENPKPENRERARAQGSRPTLDTAELYLDDPIEKFIHDAGRREQRLHYKLTRRKDESLVETLRHKDTPQFRAAFLEYLKSEDVWLVENGWPVWWFVKDDHWVAYDSGSGEDQEISVPRRETHLGSIESSEVVSNYQTEAEIVPGADLEVLTWRPHQFADYWNSLPGLPHVEWHDLHDRQAGLKAFADNEFRQNFKSACAIAEKIHALRGTEVEWLGFRWLIKSPDKGIANWWKLISGEFSWMTKPGGRPVVKTGDQAVAELHQLLEQEEKARNESNS